MANSFAGLYLLDPSPRTRRLFWHLLSVGTVTLDESDRHEGMDKPGAHLFWVRSGQGTLEVPGRSYPLKPGPCCWLVDMKKPRSYAPSPGRRIVNSGFRFGGPELEAWREELGSNNEFALERSDFEFIRKKVQNLSRLAQQTVTLQPSVPKIVVGADFVADNYVVSNEKVSANNWDGGMDFDAPDTKEGGLEAVIEKVRGKEPFKPVATVIQQTTGKACELVLANAGATLPRRDPVDTRIIESVRSGKPKFGNGIISTPADVGGWPACKSARPPADADHDGMPDSWEKKQGLNPKDAADGPQDKDGDGFTNVEEYLNGTDAAEFIDDSKAENNVTTLK